MKSKLALAPETTSDAGPPRLIDGRVTRSDVVSAYRLLLGREPESEEVIEFKRHLSLFELVEDLISSIEFSQCVASRLSLALLPTDRFEGSPSDALRSWIAASGIVDREGVGALSLAKSWEDVLLVVLSNPLFNEKTGASALLSQPVRGLAELSQASGLTDEHHMAEVVSTGSRTDRLRDFLHGFPVFDASWYLNEYPDVAEFAGGPLEHYILHGSQEYRRPNALFDPVYYKRQLSRELADNVSELEDYLSKGWLEGWRPSAEFDSIAYLERYPDLARHPFEPLTHYLLHGAGEGRCITPVGTPVAAFDARYLPLTSEKHRKAAVRLETRMTPPSEWSYDPRRLRFDWIIPDFVPGAGGHMAIFKTIEQLERRGHVVTLWIDYPNQRTSSIDVYSDLIQYFRPLKSSVRLLSEFDNIDTDVAVATDHWTVYSTVKHFRAATFMHFVQDLEPMFFGMGSDYLFAMNAYAADMLRVCSSPWLRDLMKEKGSESINFIYPADQSIYYPRSDLRLEGQPPLIAFYARAFTSRRAVEMGVLALSELSKRGVEFRVALFGQHFDKSEVWPFPVEFCDVLNERQLGDLFRRSDIGMVFSATNYSITAVEMMGSGLPIVDLDVDSTRNTYPAGAATLARPNPFSLADAIEKLLSDPVARKSQSDFALQWITSFDWSRNVEQIEAAVLRRLSASGYRRREASRVIHEHSATVVIPTLNSNDHFGELLDAVLLQKTPFPFEVLCIDSGSTNGTIAAISARPGVRLHRIERSAFNHGGTRNLGVELSKSEYIAFLTDDAIPATDRWLFDLIGVLAATPGAAGAFGRHLPYGEASPFTKRDLQAHFDTLSAAPNIISKWTEPVRFDRRDADWIRVARFYSDNNSALAKRVWERIPLPITNFGEDQMWAWEILKGGYAKVYVDAATVRHSHDYSPEQARTRARTEAAFFRLKLGDEHVLTAMTAQARLDHLNARDVVFAMRNHLPPEALARQLLLNAAVVEGQVLGGRDQEVVY